MCFSQIKNSFQEVQFSNITKKDRFLMFFRGKHRMKVTTLETWMQVRKTGVPDFCIAEVVFPVLTGAKNSGAFPPRVVGLTSPERNFNFACKLIEDSYSYKQLQGLGKLNLEVDYVVQPFRTKKAVHGRAYVLKQGNCGEVRDLFGQAYKNFKHGEASEAFSKGVQLDGRILDYPGCCIDACLEDVTNSQSTGERGTTQINDIFKAEVTEGDFAIELKKILNLPLEILQSYFALSMIPCRVGCPNAIEMGSRIHTALMNYDPSFKELYRLVLGVNVYHLWSRGGNVAFADGLVKEMIDKNT